MAGAVTFWNRKGGVGKTTLALHLAGMLAKHHKKVLLVDLDTQESTMQMISRGKFNFACAKSYAEAKKADVDFIIFDLPAGQSVIPKTKIVFVPFLPSRMDYAPTQGTKAFLLKEGKHAIEICNKFRSNQAMDRAVVEKLNEKQKARVVADRTVYQYSLNKGYTIFDDKVFELFKNREAVVKKARAEFLAVFLPFFEKYINKK